MKVDYLRKLHWLSGCVLAVFFLFHVINHLSAWGGADLHIRVMKWFRVAYRFPPVEVLLIGAACVQVVSGLALALKWREKMDRYDVVQIVSGLYLSFFLFYHIKAVMTARYFDNIETDFHFAAWGVKNSPADRFFVPYYGLSILCVFVHLACVHRRKMLGLYKGRMASMSLGAQLFSILSIGILLTIFVLIGLIRAD